VVQKQALSLYKQELWNRGKREEEKEKMKRCAKRNENYFATGNAPWRELTIRENG
jgi:hypothetical protein